jgi:hypothetical protein
MSTVCCCAVGESERKKSQCTGKAVMCARMILNTAYAHRVSPCPVGIRRAYSEGGEVEKGVVCYGCTTLKTLKR